MSILSVSYANSSQLEEKYPGPLSPSEQRGSLLKSHKSSSIIAYGGKFYTPKDTSAEGSACGLHALLGKVEFTNASHYGKYFFLEARPQYTKALIKGLNEKEISNSLYHFFEDILIEYFGAACSSFVKEHIDSLDLKELKKIRIQLDAHDENLKKTQLKLLKDVLSLPQEQIEPLLQFLKKSVEDLKKLSDKELYNLLITPIKDVLELLRKTQTGIELAINHDKLKANQARRVEEIAKRVRQKDFFDAYCKICETNGYQFSNKELGIAALLFKKRVTIFKKDQGVFDKISENGEGESVIICHFQNHFERCEEIVHPDVNKNINVVLNENNPSNGADSQIQRINSSLIKSGFESLISFRSPAERVSNSLLDKLLSSIESDSIEDVVREINRSDFHKETENLIENKIDQMCILGGLDPDNQPKEINISFARFGLQKLTNISSTLYPKQKIRALDCLIKLIELDPVNEKSAHGVIKLAINLMESMQKDLIQTEHPKLQKSIAQAYGKLVTLILKLYGKGHLNLITKELKNQFIATNDDLKRLNDTQDIELYFAIKYAQEAIFRLKDNEKSYIEIFARISDVLKGCGKLYNGKIDEAINNFYQAFKGLDKKITSKWFDAFLIVTELDEGGKTDLGKLINILLLLKEQAGLNWKFTYGVLEILDNIARESNDEEVILKMLCGLNNTCDGLVSYAQCTIFGKQAKLFKKEEAIKNDKIIRNTAFKTLSFLINHHKEKVRITAREKLVEIQLWYHKEGTNKGILEFLHEIIPTNSNERKMWLSGENISDPEETFKAAMNYELGMKDTGISPDYSRAHKLFEIAAGNGHAGAYYYLGKHYEEGLGVEHQDIKKAILHYNKSKEKMYLEAIYRLAWCHKNGRGVKQDNNKAVELLKIAVHKDHPKAIIDLAECYKKGLGTNADMAEAANLYKIGSVNEDADAIYCLASCYHNGEGVERNFAETVKLLEKAVAKEHTDAIFKLALFYRKGIQVIKDENKAFILFEKAFNKGHTEATYYLALCYENGQGIAQDLSKAAKCYEMASNKNHAESTFKLAKCYEHGYGVQKDEIMAVKFYNQASENNHAGAITLLAICYLYGKNGIKKDDETAARYLQKADKLGHVDAMFYLGICYQHGIGIEKNIEKAKSLFSSAQLCGHLTAKFCLIDLFINEYNILKYFYEKEKISSLKKLPNISFEGFLSELFDPYTLFQHVIKPALINSNTSVQISNDENFKFYKNIVETLNIESSTLANLALCYQQGIVGVKNEEEAAKLYRLAYDKVKTDLFVMYNLAIYCELGCGIAKNEVQAVALYQAVIEKDENHFEAFYKLAVCYMEGRGVAKNEAESVKILKIILEKSPDHIKAMFLLAECYENGVGTEKNERAAFELYESVVKKDTHHLNALLKLACCYNQGIGTDKCRWMCEEYYKRAAKEGSVEAQGYLLELKKQEGIEKKARDDFEKKLLSEKENEGCLIQ